MDDKRQYPRFSCKIKTDFEYYEGDPDELDTTVSIPLKAKGVIMDISRGGLFLVSNSRVGINVPVILRFRTKKQQYDLKGFVVRTGLVKNNPSEIARRISTLQVKGDSYIAVQFDTPLSELDSRDLS